MLLHRQNIHVFDPHRKCLEALEAGILHTRAKNRKISDFDTRKILIFFFSKALYCAKIRSEEGVLLPFAVLEGFRFWKSIRFFFLAFQRLKNKQIKVHDF